MAFSFLLYPGSPTVFQNMVLILLLAPVVIIIPTVFYKKLNPYIYSLAIIILLSRASDFLLYPSAFDRLTDLIIAILMLLGCAQIIVGKKRCIMDKT